jgi:hypothetical protein
MPDYDKSKDPYPYPTATDALSAPGDRETKAARNVVSRHIHGIPKRGYVVGSADEAPILRGVKDLTTATYKLLDMIRDRFEDSSESDAIAEIEAILEDHGCPEEAPTE